MAIGAGKYDDWCTQVREGTKATGVVLIVLNGEHGSGFSVQGPLDVQLVLSDLLEHVVQQLRQDDPTLRTLAAIDKASRK